MKKTLVEICDENEGFRVVYDHCDLQKLDDEKKKQLQDAINACNDRKVEVRKQGLKAIYILLFSCITSPLHEKWDEYTKMEMREQCRRCQTCKYRGTNVASDPCISKEKKEKEGIIEFVTCDIYNKLGVSRLKEKVRPECCKYYTLETGRKKKGKRPTVSEQKTEAERVIDSYFATREIGKDRGMI